MAKETINFDFNIGGGKDRTDPLVQSIYLLIKQLSGFESAVNKLVTSATNVKQAKEINPDYLRMRQTTAEASLIRAKLNQSDEGQALRRKSLENVELANKTKAERERQNTLFKDKAASAYAAGDYKLGDKYASLVEKSTSKGIETGMSKFLKAIPVAAGASFIANALSRNATLSGQIAQAAFTNPLTNYDYGSQYANINNLSAQKDYSNLSTILTAVGTGIGALATGGSLPGMAIGSAVGGGIGSVISAKGTAEAAVRGQAVGELINQRSITEAMQGTNTAAMGALQSSSRFTAGDKASELDVRKPFMVELAKGAAVYDRNFNAIDKLTDYAISAQLPLAQLKQLGANFAQIRPTDSQFKHMADLSSAYGVDLTTLSTRTLQFMQGGVEKETAANIAAKSFQNVSGFQDVQTKHFQGGYLDRTKMDIFSKFALGLDREKIMTGDIDENNKLRKMQKEASGKFGLGANMYLQAALDTAGFGQSTYNINAPEERNAANARMKPGDLQKASIDVVNNQRLSAIGGNFNASKIAADFEALAGVSSKATDSLDKLAMAAQNATIALQYNNTNNNSPSPQYNTNYPTSNNSFQGTSSAVPANNDKEGWIRYFSPGGAGTKKHTNGSKL